MPVWLTPESVIAVLVVLFGLQVLHFWFATSRKTRGVEKSQVISDDRWRFLEGYNKEFEDPVVAEVIARAVSSGNIVIANRREDGTVQYTELEDGTK